jgi:hypothetical protein
MHGLFSLYQKGMQLEDINLLDASLDEMNQGIVPTCSCLDLGAILAIPDLVTSSTDSLS